MALDNLSEIDNTSQGDTFYEAVTKCKDNFAILDDTVTQVDTNTTNITGLTAGSGVLVSANDTTIGYLNGKILAGNALTLTEGDDGDDETLTITPNAASVSQAQALTATDKLLTPASIANIAKHVITAKTADYTVDANDLLKNKTFTNTGATGEVNFTLPAGAANYKVTFAVTAAQYLKVTADGTETFSFCGTSGAAGGYVRSNSVGTVWTITWSGSDWIIAPLTGVIKYDE